MEYFFEQSHIASVLFLLIASLENLEKNMILVKGHFLNHPYLEEKALYRRHIVVVLKTFMISWN